MSCAELDEFNYFELIRYKVGQSLLKTGARIVRSVKVSLVGSKHNYKVRQPRVLQKKKKKEIVEQSIHYKLGKSLLHRGA